MEVELQYAHEWTWNGRSVVSSHSRPSWINMVWVWLRVSISSYGYGSRGSNGRTLAYISKTVTCPLKGLLAICRHKLAFPITNFDSDFMV